MRLVAGIDVAAARPCTCVLLADSVVQDWLDTRDVDELVSWLVDRWPEVIAIDAPCGLSKGLLVGATTDRGPYKGRVCDRELRRRGIPLYEVPDTREAAPGWMKVGFRIYDALQEAGYRLPKKTAMVSSMIEVYPHASFVTLIGGTPAKKSAAAGQTQRLEVLERHGLRSPDRMDHDSLDALVAALTALKFLEGQASAVGDSEEALVWLPVEQVADVYSPIPASSRPPQLDELQYLDSRLSPEQREELLQCLLIAAPRGGEAMIRVLEEMLLCHATEELLGGPVEADEAGL